MKSFKLTNLAILTITLVSSSLAFGHGEDKLGPHSGFVRMPGAFHTEVVKITNKKFKIYLLDIEWKNPSLKDSSVEATLATKSGEEQAVCETKDNYYECSLKNGSLKKGVLNIQAKRENATGGIATYKLPLKLDSHD